MLTPIQPHSAGPAVHNGRGIGPGALSGALRHRLPALTSGGGTGLNPILGTSGRATEYPADAHLRGLMGDLVFGATMHASLKLLDQVA